MKTNTWSNPPNKENAVPWPGSNYACVHYDTVSDRVICLSGWNMEGRGGRRIFAYDPATGSWEKPLLLPDSVVTGCVHGFYSPEVNAHFIYVARDSDDRGTMWVYRYRREIGGQHTGFRSRQHPQVSHAVPPISSDRCRTSARPFAGTVTNGG